jgi:hypothetical protein
MTTTRALAFFADVMSHNTPRVITVTTPPNQITQRTCDEQQRDRCGWPCFKGCFSACTRESVHPGNHVCGGGHTY